MVVRKQRVRKYRQLQMRLGEDIAIWHWIKDWYIGLCYTDITVNEENLDMKGRTPMACLM